jgi:hypothetical protein
LNSQAGACNYRPAEGIMNIVRRTPVENIEQGISNIEQGIMSEGLLWRILNEMQSPGESPVKDTVVLVLVAF